MRSLDTGLEALQEQEVGPSCKCKSGFYLWVPSSSCSHCSPCAHDCSRVQLDVVACLHCHTHRVHLLKLRHLIRALCGSSAISDNGPLLRDFVSKLHFGFRPK